MAGEEGEAPESRRRALRRFWDAANLTSGQRSQAEFSARRYPPILRFLEPALPDPSARVLDLGGGIGALAVAMHEHFGGSYDVADHAPIPITVRRILPQFGIGAAYTIRLDPPAGALKELPCDYDLVLLVEVIEHLLVNPLLLFREIHDHLRPGGRLLITTPNMARFSNRHRLARGHSIKEPGRYPLDASSGYGHVQEYTRPELEYLLGWEAFRPVKACVVHNAPGAAASARQRAGTWLLNSRLARRLELGDEMLLLYESVPRSPAGTNRPPRV